MTLVRQNDPALPPFARPAPRPHSEAEIALIRTLARGGQGAAAIVEKLAERGFTRTHASVANSMTFIAARRERREAQALEEAARRAVRETVETQAPSTRGIRHPDFPGITLPRVSIQAGCQSFPEAWGA